MSAALDLIRKVEANGGQIRIDGEDIVIAPKEAAAPLVDSLRAHKAEIVALLQNRTEQEPESARDSDALGLWMLGRCVYRDRCFGGVGTLYLDLARWCAEHRRAVPASRRAFTAELKAKGFAVTTDGLVYGLMLGEDWEAHERFQAAPEARRTPECATGGTRRNAGRRRP